MSSGTLPALQKRIGMVHGLMLKAGSTITAAQFAQIFSPHAPPIGWHLWHITRFADRLQAKLAAVTDGAVAPEFWYHDALATRWELPVAAYGMNDTGAGQPHSEAVRLVAEAGQANIVAYAQTVFAQCDTVLGKLTADLLECSYFGIMDFDTDVSTGRIWATEPRESLVVEDLAFHLNHASRHFGAMEALRGLLGSAGSITV